MEKIRLEKVRKHVFYKHTNIVTKKGGGREEKIVKKLTNRVSEICWKKIVLIKTENTFFINTCISWWKFWGKKREKNFSKNKRIGYTKKCWKKIDSKNCEKMFFKKHMNIVTKNGGKKSEKKFLPESYVYREQKTMEKNRLKKVRKNVF